MLLRKRMLRHVGQRHRQDRREMLVRRAGETAGAAAIAVLDPGLAASEVESIAGQLAPILSALEQPDAEVLRRMKAMRRHVRRRDVHHWAQSFLEELAR